jgi:hypothetical protein
MTEQIWVSDSFGNTSIISKLTTNPDVQQDDYRAELERMDKVMRKYEKGITLDEEERPQLARPRYKDTRIGKLPDFFCVNVFFIVSSAFADVVGRFDLGKGGLSPIELHQGNRTELVPGDWHLLNFGCVKEAFLSERSTGGFDHPQFWPEGRWPQSVPRTTRSLYRHRRWRAATCGPIRD